MRGEGVYVIVYDRTTWGDTPVNPTTYRTLKSLSFNPETDITLASVPICEFTVEIMTANEVIGGQRIRLYDDKDTLYADYRVMKVERIADQIMRVLAQSELALLDTWTLKAVRVTGSMGIQTIMAWAENPTYIKSGTPKHINYILASDVLDRDARVTGFFPEQTARERLQQMCITCGLTVHQWFCHGLLLTRVNEVGQIPAFPSTLIPASDTFSRPERQYVEPAGSFAAYMYSNWQTAEPEGDGWVEVKDDISETTWYAFKGYSGEAQNEDNDEGKAVEISDVMIINPDNVSSVYERKWRFFIAEEYTIDVINNGQYYPNMPVKFYFDTDGNLSNAIIIDGIITKCDFTFGVQNRAKLTIARIPNTTPQAVHCMTVHYVYEYTVDDGEGGTTEKTLALGRNEYYVPSGTLVDFDLPTIYIDVVGDTLAFVVDRDDTRNIYGYTAGDHDAEYTLYYKREEAS